METMATAPARVANAIAQRTLDLVVDIPTAPDERLEQATKRRKVARRLRDVGMITPAEYREHEVFHARCIAAAAGVVADDGAPAWFGPALAAGLAPVLARLDTIEARQCNSVAMDIDDPLQAIMNAEGIAAPNFPGTLGVLIEMSEDQMNSFLTHYGQPVNEDERLKRQRMRKFIGMRPV